MTAPTLDLFDNPEAGSNPGPREQEPTPTGPALDWQLQPAKTDAAGKARPRFVWPTNYPPSRRQTVEQRVAAAESKADRIKQRARARTAREIAHDLAAAQGEVEPREQAEE